MSIELEGLLSECADAGVCFYVRGGNVSLRMAAGPISQALLSRIAARKDEIKRWLVSSFSVARCIDCPYAERCPIDGCMQAPPALGSSRANQTKDLMERGLA